LATSDAKEVAVSHPDDESQVVLVRPPLAPSEVAVVAGLAGAATAPRRMWPGQPGPRSPWLPCKSGCCLVAEERPGVDPATWLRFLLRELLAPQAQHKRERAERLGLPGGHRVEGRILLERGSAPRVLVATGRRVRMTAAQERGHGTER
jgi:hypothetical protein